MAGALDGLGVRQVECGLNLTVALTVDGRVWQMGETGAASERQAPWDRALAPVQVGAQALGFRVDQLWAGKTGSGEAQKSSACISIYGQGKPRSEDVLTLLACLRVLPQA